MIHSPNNYFLALFVGAVMAASAGCGDDAAPGGGTGGSTGNTGGTTSSTGGTGASTGGSGGGSATGDVAIIPDASGWVDGKNEAKVLGAWYVYADSLGSTGTPPGDCQSKGSHTDAECSKVDSPEGGKAFTNTGGSMCTKGTAAAVLKLGADPDYSNMWGAGIGLDLNHPADGEKLPLDLSAYKGISFTFTSTQTPAAPMRAEFPNPDVKDAHYWGATAGWGNSPFKAGVNEVLFEEVLAPGPDGATAPKFDPSKVLAIQFHVPTATGAARPFDYCISDLKLLKK